MVVADERIIGMRTYEADVEWDGAIRTIEVHESEGGIPPLHRCRSRRRGHSNSSHALVQQHGPHGI